jgi:hypothetical protein
VRQPTCHPERPHEARGLCEACYQKARAMGILASFPKMRAGTSNRRDYWREWKRRKAEKAAA